MEKAPFLDLWRTGGSPKNGVAFLIAHRALLVRCTLLVSGIYPAMMTRSCFCGGVPQRRAERLAARMVFGSKCMQTMKWHGQFRPGRKGIFRIHATLDGFTCF